ncbi:MAG: NGG1p interacting factor NIF3 [Nitrospirae bacterium]|nr:MAG: NGG1p interacting factor NIF3 [Nitrospirota bacterium]
MTLRELFKKAIEAGIANDPRGRETVLKDLGRAEKEYADLKPEEKELFDREALVNPYSDSRILYGSGDPEIAHVLVGIDIEVGEVLLAETLKRKGRPVDLILSHHPEGTAYATLYSVMNMQSDILSRFGVPINIAEDLMDGRMREVERRLMPLNHTRAVDAARLVDIPFACLHTPADNMVVTFLQKLFDDARPETLADLMDIIRGIPEYRTGALNGSGPKIITGSKTRKAGRVFVDMTGGTEGSKEIFSSLASAGVNTIVGMHISEEHRKEAEKNHMNVVIAGHISSDNLGVNLLLDEITRGCPLNILECSGFTRVTRNS